jgi:hypothetical protein
LKYNALSQVDEEPPLDYLPKFDRAFYTDNNSHVKNRAKASKTILVKKPNITLAFSGSLFDIQMIKTARTMPTGKVQYQFRPKSNEACHEAPSSGKCTNLAMNGQTTPANSDRKMNTTPWRSAILLNVRPARFPLWFML